MFDLFKGRRERKYLIAEIKKEFPKEEQDPLDNEVELLHKGLDEGNNIYVRYFLLKKSKFNEAELEVSENKNDNEEVRKDTDAKARALALYDRWVKLNKMKDIRTESSAQ